MQPARARWAAQATPTRARLVLPLLFLVLLLAWHPHGSKDEDWEDEDAEEAAQAAAEAAAEAAAAAAARAAEAAEAAEVAQGEEEEAADVSDEPTPDEDLLEEGAAAAAPSVEDADADGSFVVVSLRSAEEHAIFVTRACPGPAAVFFEAGRATATAAMEECLDLPGWHDFTKGQFGCSDYVRYGWCTPSGGHGPRWKLEAWGPIGSRRGSDDLDAISACCGCGRRSSQADTNALGHFAAAARDLNGMACFATLSCESHPGACKDLNVRRQPTVVVYPRPPAAAFHYKGALEKAPLLAVMAGQIGLLARDVAVVTALNIDSFLSGALRPLKAMLFSSRKIVPVILQALSSEPQLRGDVHFGFVKHSEQALTSKFQISEVPHMLLQVGRDSSTLEAFPGSDMTYFSLRSWLLECVQRYRERGLINPPAQPEEATEGPPDSDIDEGTALRATQVASVYKAFGNWEVLRLLPRLGNVVAAGTPFRVRGFSLVPIKPQGVVDKGLFTLSRGDTGPKYQLMPYGAQACPVGQSIDTVEECQAAILALDIVAQPSWVSNFPELPSMCSVRETASEDSPQRMHFNSASGGKGRRDLAPVCRVPGSPQEQEADNDDSTDEAEEEAQEAVQVEGVDLAAQLLPDDLLPLLDSLSPAELLQKVSASARKHLEKVASATAREKGAAQKTAAAGEKPPRPPSPKKTSKASAKAQKADDLDASLFRKMKYGTSSCPKGLEIRSVQDCERAIVALGMVAKPMWVSAYPELPSGCSIRESPGSGSAERMHFNAAPTGKGREDLAPVCLKDMAALRIMADRQQAALRGGGGSSGAPDVSAEEVVDAKLARKETGSAIVPHLSSLTYEELLGDGAVVFVFLREGPIDLQEEEALAQLAARFVPQAKEQGWTLRFAWMNLRLERKMKGIFDPVVLPSAAALDAKGDAENGWRPRFALMDHKEEDGDPAPAATDELELFLNKLIGGDAVFTPVSRSKLAKSWATLKK